MAYMQVMIALVWQGPLAAAKRLVADTSGLIADQILALGSYSSTEATPRLPPNAPPKPYIQVPCFPIWQGPEVAARYSREFSIGATDVQVLAAGSYISTDLSWV